MAVKPDEAHYINRRLKAMKEKRKIKGIALELLEKYKDSEESVIWERSTKIWVDLDELEAEIQKYKAEIENVEG